MQHYNTFRPHQALQYQTPWQYYVSLGAQWSHTYWTRIPTSIFQIFMLFYNK